MLRWIALLFGTCAASGATGFGLIGSVDGSARNFCLTLTVLSGALLISFFDAYETEKPVRTDD